MDEITKDLLALGDNVEWKIFYSKYEAHIRRIITNRISDKNYIDDLVNEVFEILLLNFYKYDINLPLENWISKITVFHCINHHRKQKSIKKKFSNFNFMEIDHVNPSNNITQVDHIIDKENLSILKNSFNNFSDTEKKILSYRLLKNYKYIEIEKELDVNISTIKNTIRKYKIKFNKSFLN